VMLRLVAGSPQMAVELVKDSSYSHLPGVGTALLANTALTASR